MRTIPHTSLPPLIPTPQTTHHASCNVSGDGYPEVPREQSLCVLDGLSECSSVCILCDEDKDLAFLVEDPNKLEDVGVAQTLQQLDLEPVVVVGEIRRFKEILYSMKWYVLHGHTSQTWYAYIIWRYNFNFLLTL